MFCCREGRRQFPLASQRPYSQRRPITWSNDSRKVGQLTKPEQQANVCIVAIVNQHEC